MVEVSERLSFTTKVFYLLLTVATVLYIYSFNFGGINLSLFRGLFIGWCLYFLKDVLFLKRVMRRSHSFLVWLYVLIILLNLVDLLRLAPGSLLAKDIFNHLVNLTLVYLVVVYVNSEEKIHTLIRYYMLGSLLALYIAIFSWIAGTLPFEWLIREYQSEIRGSQNFVTSFRLIPRFTSSFTDPSFYGLYLCFVLALCLYYNNYVRKRGWVNALFFLNVLALAITMSRTALIGFSMVLTVSVFSIRRFVNKMLWLVPVAGGCVIFLVANPEIARSVIAFDIYTNLESANARQFYWEHGLDVFLSHPLTGGGAELLSNDGRISSAHLVYLSLLAKYGVLGFTIYATFLCYPVLYVMRNRRRMEKKYVYLVTAIYLALFVMYLGYDFFQFLEFQYLIFGIVYSIVLNRIGLVRGTAPVAETLPAAEPLEAGKTRSGEVGLLGLESGA